MPLPSQSTPAPQSKHILTSVIYVAGLLRAARDSMAHWQTVCMILRVIHFSNISLAKSSNISKPRLRVKQDSTSCWNEMQTYITKRCSHFCLTQREVCLCKYFMFPFTTMPIVTCIPSWQGPRQLCFPTGLYCLVFYWLNIDYNKYFEVVDG